MNFFASQQNSDTPEGEEDFSFYCFSSGDGLYLHSYWKLFHFMLKCDSFQTQTSINQLYFIKRNHFRTFSFLHLNNELSDWAYRFEVTTTDVLMAIFRRAEHAAVRQHTSAQISPLPFWPEILVLHELAQSQLIINGRQTRSESFIHRQQPIAQLNCFLNHFGCWSFCDFECRFVFSFFRFSFFPLAHLFVHSFIGLLLIFHLITLEVSEEGGKFNNLFFSSELIAPLSTLKQERDDFI